MAMWWKGFGVCIEWVGSLYNPDTLDTFIKLKSHVEQITYLNFETSAFEEKMSSFFIALRKIGHLESPSQEMEH